MLILSYGFLFLFFGCCCLFVLRRSHSAVQAGLKLLMILLIQPLSLSFSFFLNRGECSYFWWTTNLKYLSYEPWNWEEQGFLKASMASSAHSFLLTSSVKPRAHCIWWGVRRAVSIDPVFHFVSVWDSCLPPCWRNKRQQLENLPMLNRLFPSPFLLVIHITIFTVWLKLLSSTNYIFTLTYEGYLAPFHSI